jgi:CRP/FNR family nitrogen fixation transcriptional regulator
MGDTSLWKETDMLMRSSIGNGYGRQVAALQRGVPSMCERFGLDGIECGGFIISYPSEVEIFGERGEGKYVYKVLIGTVRTCKTSENGRRQIAGFYLRGDIFGLEVRDEHILSAEAAAETKLLLINRSALFALAERDNSVARELWMLTVAELRRVQDHCLLLSRSSVQRVAGFLVGMAQRLRARDKLELPMGRQDIADYLGLTIETVSRTFSALEKNAAIEIPTSRRIVFRDYSELVRLSA